MGQIKLRIDWSHMDMFGHVNNISFFSYIQSARAQFWRTSGIESLYKEQKTAPMLVNAGLDFKHPLYYPGNATVYFLLDFIGTSSFGLKYEIHDDQSNLCAVGKDAMVLWDFDNMKKVPIAPRLREKMNLLQ